MATEGNVDWDAAKEFFTGKNKPAEEGAAPDANDETSQEPQLVEVRVKGRTLKLQAEDAAVIEEWRREGRERDGRLGGENAAMKERLARLEGRIEEAARRPVSAPPELRPPDPKLVETDFAAWQAQYTAYNAAKMVEMQSDLETRYRGEKAQDQAAAEQARASAAWASKFYDSYDHLKNPHLRSIVQTVYQQHEADVLGAGDVDAQHERLAQLADEALVALKVAGKATTNRKPPNLEGASTPAKSGYAKDERKPISGATWMKQKRAQLRGEGVKK